MSEIDPFAPQTKVRVKFMAVKLFSTPVEFKKGEHYTLPGVHDKEGNIREFRGKKVNKSSTQHHVVMHGKAINREGDQYEMVKDHMINEDPYNDVVYPSLKKVFGDNFPVKSYVHVKVEEVETGETFPGNDGNDVKKTTWKFVERYKSEDEMKAAEANHFSSFSSNGHSESDGPEFSPEEVTAFRKAKAKNKTISQIVADLVDDDVITKFGTEKCEAAVEAALAE